MFVAMPRMFVAMPRMFVASHMRIVQVMRRVSVVLALYLRVVTMIVVGQVQTVLAEERLVHDPGHVRRGEECTNRTRRKGEAEVVFLRMRKDLVFREESRERRNAAKR